MGIDMNKKCLVSAIAAMLITPLATAAPVAYVTQNSVGGMGNPQTWGGLSSPGKTGQSVAFELTFDFTSAIDGISGPLLLWEAGATGSGAALVIDDDNIHFMAGDGSDDIVSGLHGLAGGADDVQIVSVFEIGAGANGTDEKLSLYINGSLLDSTDRATANIWAGSDAGGLGIVQGGAGARYSNGSPPFDGGAVANFPNNGTEISLNVYRLASSGGDPDNTLANILVPEPSSLALLGLGGLLAARRRRG